jgi:hypothetical protein
MPAALALKDPRMHPGRRSKLLVLPLVFASAGFAGGPASAAEAPSKTGQIHIAGTVPPHASVTASAWALSPADPGAADKSPIIHSDFTYTGNARGLAVSVLSPAGGAQLPFLLSDGGVRQDSIGGRVRLDDAGVAHGVMPLMRTIEVRLPSGEGVDQDALRDGLVLVITAP